MSGSTAQDPAWSAKEKGEEARYVQAKEQEQLAALRAKLDSESESKKEASATTSNRRDDIEGGFGGQEDLEDRYATTSGEH